MTTNLLFAYPDIPFQASSHTLPDKGADADYNKDSVVAGSRVERFQFDTTSDTPSHLFDLGASYTGLQSQASYLIVSQAHLLLAGGSTSISLGGRTGTIGAFTYPVSAVAWTTSDLVGPLEQDYITTFNLTSQYRQWSVELHGSASTEVFPHGQIYFGQMFDFGRDPEWGRRVKLDYYQDKAIHQRLGFELKYRGITETKRQEFEEKIGQYSETHPIFLYAQSYDPVLFDLTLVQCVIESYSFNRNNFATNDLDITLYEII